MKIGVKRAHVPIGPFCMQGPLKKTIHSHRMWMHNCSQLACWENFCGQLWSSKAQACKYKLCLVSIREEKWSIKLHRFNCVTISLQSNIHLSVLKTSNYRYVRCSHRTKSRHAVHDWTLSIESLWPKECEVRLHVCSPLHVFKFLAHAIIWKHCVAQSSRLWPHTARKFIGFCSDSGAYVYFFMLKAQFQL